MMVMIQAHLVFILFDVNNSCFFSAPFLIIPNSCLLFVIAPIHEVNV